MIFDFDDAIFLGARGAKLRAILPYFAAVTAGNRYLARFVDSLNSCVQIWPTVIDTSLYQPVKERPPGPIRLGWSGSIGSARHALPVIRDVLGRLAKNLTFELILIAERPPETDFPGVSTRFISWTPETEVEGLQHIDIGLMPLRDEPFEQGKCGFKAIQYMGVGKPAVVSPVGVNREIVVNGQTGFHCRTEDEWVECLTLLARDPGLRRRMGRAGRERVEAHYSVCGLLPRMVEQFEAVARQ